MNVEIFDDPKDASMRAAEIAIRSLHKTGKASWALPTGETPKFFYEALVDAHLKHSISFKDVTTFNLDEYVGTDIESVNSYHHYMNSHFFNHVDIPTENAHIPNGLSLDLDQECKNYEKLIEKAGGIDIAFLGIGVNGHIGFNEPSSEIHSKTRVVELHKMTRNANRDHFDDPSKMPTHAISMGLKTILDSREIVLMAFGENKANSVFNMIKCTLTPIVPASYLQTHKNVTVLLDRKAAMFLSEDL